MINESNSKFIFHAPYNYGRVILVQGKCGSKLDYLMERHYPMGRDASSQASALQCNFPDLHWTYAWGSV